MITRPMLMTTSSDTQEAVFAEPHADSIKWSNNGIAWFMGQGDLTNGYHMSCYGDNAFHFLGDKCGKNVYISLDGKTTTLTGVLPTVSGISENDSFKYACYGKGKIIIYILNAADSYRGRIFYSANHGSSWSTACNMAGFNVYSIRYLNGNFVAVGDTASPSISGVGCATSSNGVSWTKSSSYVQGYWKDVTYFNGEYIAIGTQLGSSQYKILKSSNGSSWSVKATPSATNFIGIRLYSANSMIFTWNSSRLFYSRDAINWSSAYCSSGFRWLEYCEMFYHNGKFLIFGSGLGTGITYSSTDGINWDAIPSATSGGKVCFKQNPD